MIEFWSCWLKFLCYCKFLCLKVIRITLVVNERCWDKKLYTLGIVYLIHSRRYFPNFMRQIKILNTIVILCIDNSHDRFCILLNVKNDMILKYVHIGKNLIRLKFMNDFLTFLVIFLCGDGILGLLFSPNDEVIITVVDLKLFSEWGLCDWS